MDADTRAIAAGTLPNPQADWYQFIMSPAGQAVKPPDALLNMLYLMPALTPSDKGFQLQNKGDMIEVIKTLEESLDTRGHAKEGRLWHLSLMHAGYDMLNPHTMMFREVKNMIEFRAFLNDLIENIRGTEGFACPPTEYMDPKNIIRHATRMIGLDTENLQLHPCFLMNIQWGDWK